jgi:YD repeat-containing protein
MQAVEKMRVGLSLPLFRRRQQTASGAGSIRPHAPNHIDVRSFTYDANGHEKTYKYDDQGQRAIKRGPRGETVYVNQFFTDRPGANGTKHIYAGTARIASKLMRQDTPVPIRTVKRLSRRISSSITPTTSAARTTAE